MTKSKVKGSPCLKLNGDRQFWFREKKEREVFNSSCDMTIHKKDVRKSLRDIKVESTTGWYLRMDDWIDSSSSHESPYLPRG